MATDVLEEVTPKIIVDTPKPDVAPTRKTKSPDELAADIQRENEKIIKGIRESKQEAQDLENAEPKQDSLQWKKRLAQVSARRGSFEKRVHTHSKGSFGVREGDDWNLEERAQKQERALNEVTQRQVVEAPDLLKIEDDLDEEAKAIKAQHVVKEEAEQVINEEPNSPFQNPDDTNVTDEEPFEVPSGPYIFTPEDKPPDYVDDEDIKGDEDEKMAGAFKFGKGPVKR